MDTSGSPGSHSHNQDADNCDTTICCAEYINISSGITISYTPLVTALVVPERYQKLPIIVLPIFIPPQNLA
jgi:hypothetical protein